MLGNRHKEGLSRLILSSLLMAAQRGLARWRTQWSLRKPIVTYAKANAECTSLLIYSRSLLFFYQLICVSAFRRIHSCMDVYSCTRTRKCTESNAPGCEVHKKQESGSEQTQRQKKSYLGCYFSRETRIIRCCEEERVRFLIRMLYMFVHFPPFYVIFVFFSL